MNPIRNHRNKGKKSANIWELEGEQEISGITRDVFGFKMEFTGIPRQSSGPDRRFGHVKPSHDHAGLF